MGTFTAEGAAFLYRNKQICFSYLAPYILSREISYVVKVNVKVRSSPANVKETRERVELHLHLCLIDKLD